MDYVIISAACVKGETLGERKRLRTAGYLGESECTTGKRNNPEGLGVRSWRQFSCTKKGTKTFSLGMDPSFKEWTIHSVQAAE